MFPDNRIREYRKRAGLSQTELGKAVGLHQTMIGNIENGKRSLTLEWARRFAKVFGCAVADLLTDSDNPDRLKLDEATLLETYRAAPEEQKPNITRVAESLSGYRARDERAA